MDNIHVVQKTTQTTEKKPVVLVLPYLGLTSLKTRTKFKKSFKKILSCCKLLIVIGNFHFKDCISKDFSSVVVHKFQCGLLNESFYV